MKRKRILVTMLTRKKSILRMMLTRRKRVLMTKMRRESVLKIRLRQGKQRNAKENSASSIKLSTKLLP